MVSQSNEQNSPFKTDHKVDFGLSRNVEVSGLSCLALKSDLLLLLGQILLDILIRTLEDDLALRFLVLQGIRTSQRAINTMRRECSAPKDGI